MRKQGINPVNFKKRKKKSCRFFCFVLFCFYWFLCVSQLKHCFCPMSYPLLFTLHLSLAYQITVSGHHSSHSPLIHLLCPVLRGPDLTGKETHSQVVTSTSETINDSSIYLTCVRYVGNTVNKRDI